MNPLTLTPYRAACLKQAAQMLSSLSEMMAPCNGDEESLLTSQQMALSEAHRAMVSFIWHTLDEADFDANCDTTCPVCGATMQGTHAPWCERRDGTPVFTGPQAA